MQITESRLRFHSSLFLRDQLTILFNIGSDNGLAPTTQQVIILINDG